MRAVLLKLIYLCTRTVDCCKSLAHNDFLVFRAPCYPARRHVIPQICGIYQ